MNEELQNNQEIKVNGIYQHYKGKEYKILRLVKDSETQEDKVVYEGLYEDHPIWIRSLAEFTEIIEENNEKKPRFALLREEKEEDYKDQYLRALADYQNLLKQNTKEKEEFYKYVLASFLEEIIPVYDNLKLSIANLSEVETKNPWVEGVKYVLQEFKRIMEERGVLEIKTIGEKFDPSTMEAISGQGEIVTKEARAGYKLNNKVIIPAKVILEEKTEGKAEDEIKN